MSGKFVPLRHWFRIAALAFFIAAGLALTILWVRSYRVAERLHGRLAADRLFIVASKEGRVTAILFPPAFHPGHWRWQIRRYPVENELAFPDEYVRQHESILGFGVFHQAYYSLDQLFGPPRISSDSSIQFNSDAPRNVNSRFIESYANFVTLDGIGIIVPYWFLVAMAAANAFVLWIKRPWRFSLRSLFVIVTLVAILLTMVVVLDNGSLR
jgi:hypothetical protein